MLVASGRVVGGHVTPENHEAILARACGQTRRQIEALVAELAPRPDVPTSVRKLPTPPSRQLPAATPSSPATPGESATGNGSERTLAITAPAVRVVPSRRPIVEPTSPQRYRVQFTIGK